MEEAAKVPIHMVGTCCRPDATQLDGCLDKSLDHPMLLKILEQHPLSLVIAQENLFMCGLNENFFVDQTLCLSDSLGPRSGDCSVFPRPRDLQNCAPRSPELSVAGI